MHAITRRGSPAGVNSCVDATSLGASSFSACRATSTGTAHCRGSSGGTWPSDVLARDWYSLDSNADKYVLKKLVSIGETEYWNVALPGLRDGCLPASSLARAQR